MSASVFRIIADDIKIAHSIFALPFAVLGACMAGAYAAGPEGRDVSGMGVSLLLVVVAMVFARTSAMLANRILDHKIDAENPRTQGRAIPSGRLPLRTAYVSIGISSVGFMGVCLLFGILNDNWWPMILGLPVLGWICAYGLFKRFTWFCHVWLGASLGLSPLAAAIAINPAVLSTPAIWLLAGMVTCWVAGFDVIYALQDIDIDRRDGLNSIPARFGMSGALLISKTLHVIAAALLFGVWWTVPQFQGLFLAATIMVALLLLVEHATVKKWGTTKMALTFVTINGVVSLAVGLAGVIDLFTHSA